MSRPTGGQGDSADHDMVVEADTGQHVPALTVRPPAVELKASAAGSVLLGRTQGSLLSPPPVRPRTTAEASTPALTLPDSEPPASLGLDRASFAVAVSTPGLYDLDGIRAAVERADHEDAAIRALARLQCGLELPPELVADILVGVGRSEVFLPLARHMTRDSVEPAVELLCGGRFAANDTGADQTAYTAFVIWRLQAPELARPVIVPCLRRLCRGPWLPLLAGSLVRWLVGQIGDPHLQAIYDKYQGEFGDELGRMFAGFATVAWNAPVDEVLRCIPERASEATLGNAPVYATPKIGRNDICPCGSDKKYKRCCGSNPASRALSRVERLRALEPRLERDHIAELSRAELALLDLTRLRDDAVIAVMSRQVQLRDWRRACDAVDEFMRRQRHPDATDKHLVEVIYQAMFAGHHDVAGQLSQRVVDRNYRAAIHLAGALAARAPDALASLEAAAIGAVAATNKEADVDLAYTVLCSMPALGILLARGALRAGDLYGGNLLLDQIEVARDQLQLPPDDPAQETFAALGGVRNQKAAVRADAERAHLSRTTAELRATLDQAAERIAALQRQVADRERELAQAERVIADAGQGTIESPAVEQERRMLRDKIDDLQAHIRERNEDRAKLRRQLADAMDSKATAPSAPSAPGGHGGSDQADEGMEELPARAAARRVLVPRFGATAAAALETIPGNVAANAMHAIGALAAGDTAAWRSVKQAKDMSRQLLMTRIGIHHRLLFRTDDGALDIVDLVTRESLQSTLKRLRAT